MATAERVVAERISLQIFGSKLQASGFCYRIHDGQQFRDDLLAFGGVRRAGSEGFERTVDCLIDGVPVGGGARLQRGFRIIPLRLEILDARFGASQIASKGPSATSTATNIGAAACVASCFQRNNTRSAIP
jgi:hypothetical protein